MSNGRYAKIWGDIFQSTMWGQRDPVRIIGIYLFVEANYKDGEVQGTKIKRGQLYRAQGTIAEDCHYSRQTVRTSLKRLVDIEFIRIEHPNGVQKPSLITVVNYDKFQGATPQPSCQSSCQSDCQSSCHEQEEDKKGKNSRVARPGSAEEVTAYAKSIGFALDGQYFIDSNIAKGWKVGKTQTPMKDWKAVVRTWKRNSIQDTPKKEIRL